jgi:hypothetical protein
MDFYNPYDDKDDDGLDKNDDWKNYKPCDDCGEPFLKSDLIYVATNNDDIISLFPISLDYDN